MWQILTRSIGYLSPTSGRPTEALKWSLASQQASDDYERKREYVGSALVVWLLFLPVTLVLGAVLIWFVPIWFKAPPDQVTPVRVALAFLVLNLVLNGLTVIPQAILRGENLGYKRMGMSTIFVFLGGGLTWLALLLDLGLPGVAVAGVGETAITGLFLFVVAKRYVPWFGIKLPPFRETRKFLNLSVWFMIWNLVMISFLSSDVLVLGFFDSAEAVSNYTLTKYAPEMAISIIAMIIFGITPGLGGIIGVGERTRAIRVRGELMTMTWLVTTALGGTVLLWNRVFTGLWVGEQHYLGALPSLLIVLVVTQFVFIRNDANIIDLTLDLPAKVLLGLAASTLAIVIAAVFIAVAGLGVVGLSLGLLLGRSVLSIGYPLMIGRYLEVDPLAEIRAIIRPALVTAVLFGAAFLVDRSAALADVGIANTWVGFLVFASAVFGVLLATEYYAGLTGRQRKAVQRRARAAISSAKHMTE